MDFIVRLPSRVTLNFNCVGLSHIEKYRPSWLLQLSSYDFWHFAVNPHMQSFFFCLALRCVWPKTNYSKSNPQVGLCTGNLGQNMSFWPVKCFFLALAVRKHLPLSATAQPVSLWPAAAVCTVGVFKHRLSGPTRVHCLRLASIISFRLWSSFRKNNLQE